MRYPQTLLLPLFAAVLLAACKKEQANGKPRVTITAPAEFAQVSVPDTLLVTVEAQDDIGLQSLGITLLNADRVPIVAAVTAPVSGTSATRTLALPLTSEQLQGGACTLLATASDGSLSGTDELAIHLNPAPLRVRMVFTLAAPAAGTVDLYRTDSTGQTAPAASWAMDLGGAAVSAASQRLFVAGSAGGDLRALSPTSLATVWQLPNQSTIGAPWFTSVDLCADGRLYVGQDNGTLRAFNPANGTGGSVATLTEAYKATHAITTGDLLVNTQRHFITHEQGIGIHFRLSGAAAEVQPLDLDPVALYARDADHVLIFGNRNGQGRVLERTLSGGGTWEVYAWPGEVAAVEALGGSSWLVALSTGDLQRFTYGGAGSISLGTTPVLTCLAYDAVSGWVYGGTEGQVLRIDPGTGATTTAWAVNGAVLRVLPLLNREP